MKVSMKFQCFVDVLGGSHGRQTNMCSMAVFQAHVLCMTSSHSACVEAEAINIACMQAVTPKDGTQLSVLHQINSA